ncbi:hypothetical protein MC885_002745 [Smutsia gigantea]|nr:hypothetical protein MC885_002745 [Smutsia gigantea]
MACAAALSPADQDRFICIYPAYLNNKKTIAEGRRIPVSKVSKLAPPVLEGLLKILQLQRFKMYAQQLDLMCFLRKIKCTLENGIVMFITGAESSSSSNRKMAASVLYSSRHSKTKKKHLLVLPVNKIEMKMTVENLLLPVASNKVKEKEKLKGLVCKSVMLYAAEMIPKLKTRTQKTGGGDQSLQQGEGSKKGKGKKKK